MATAPLRSLSPNFKILHTTFTHHVRLVGDPRLLCLQRASRIQPPCPSAGPATALSHRDHSSSCLTFPQLGPCPQAICSLAARINYSFKMSNQVLPFLCSKPFNCFSISGLGHQLATSYLSWTLLSSSLSLSSAHLPSCFCLEHRRVFVLALSSV